MSRSKRQRRRRGGFRPPHCPNPACPYHLDARHWLYRPRGSWVRPADQRRFRAWRCSLCGRNFSARTFSPSYWMRRRDLLARLAPLIVEGAALRQSARVLGRAPATVTRACARLGRHCLLFHQTLVARQAPRGPLVADGFESFAYSQYFPYHLNLAASAESWFIHGFTFSPLRRKGRMTPAQKARRNALERRYGRPDPRAVARGMAALVAPLARRLPPGATLVIHSDDHRAYPPALRAACAGLPLKLEHRITSATARRTTSNALFPVNLADLLLRHSSANHRRETIAFSKTVAGVLERAAVFLVWRNTIKRRRENGSERTAAMIEGLLGRRLSWGQILRRRLFPRRTGLTPEWTDYYWRRVKTAVFGERQVGHACRYAF
jgi:hypothetical protein